MNAAAGVDLLSKVGAAIERVPWVPLHVLPAGFHRIRYYGLFGNRHRADRLAQCRRLLGMPSAPAPLVLPAVLSGTTSHRRPQCPLCQTGHMIRIDEVPHPRHRAMRLDSS